MSFSIQFEETQIHFNKKRSYCIGTGPKKERKKKNNLETLLGFQERGTNQN